MYFHGYLIGDPFDTRLMISQHEHWTQFFLGERNLRDTFTFYPYDKALGLTDSFLIPSLQYSFFRILNYSVLDAWSLATFLFFFVGNLGWVFLARRLISKFSLQFFFVLTISSTPTLVSLLERAPNAAGYSWLSWLLYLTIVGINQLKEQKRNYGFGALFIILPAIMLSSWYPAFFYIITALTSLVIFLLFKLFRKDLTTLLILQVISKHSIPIYYPLIGTLILFMWAYIHLPAASISNRNWDETISNSAYFSQLIDQNYLNNGWFYLFVKNQSYNAFENSSLGIPFFIIVFALLSIVVTFKKNLKINKVYLYFLMIPGVIVTLLFTRLTEDLSLFKILWQTIPGFYSIRFPYRYHIVLSFILIIIIFIFLQEITIKLNNRLSIRILSTIIGLVLLVDNYKPPLKIWTKNDFISEKLALQLEEIENKCDFFILDKPGGWWDDQISAIAMSTLINVPTANGYSGGFPLDYPKKPWQYEGDISEILNWSKFGNGEIRGCVVSDTHSLIKSNPGESQIYFHAGFSPEESDKKNNIWRWTESNTAYIILNIPTNYKQALLSIRVKTASCVNKNQLTVSNLTTKEKSIIFIEKKEKQLDFVINNSTSGINQIKLEVNDKYCNYPNDPRNLYFEIKNYEVIEK